MPLLPDPRRIWTQTWVRSGLILLPLWVWVWLDLQNNLERERGEAEVALRGLTQVSAQSLRGGLKLMDFMLQQLCEQWQHEPQRFEASVRKFQQQWGDGHERLQVAVVSETGRVRFSSLNPGAVGLDVSDREPFRIHRHHLRDQLHVGPALTTRVEQNTWFVPFSRPIVRPDGGFGGLVNVLIPPQFLTELYGSAVLDSGSTVTLLRQDDALILRSIPDPQVSGQLAPQLPPPTPNTDPRASAVVVSSLQDSGFMVRTSNIDSVRRLYGWEKLPEFDLVLLLGRSESAQLDIARLYESRYFVISAVLSLLVVLLILWRQKLAGVQAQALHTQTRQIEELQRSQDELTTAQAALRDLNTQLVNLKETEGKRIAQEIHDELGQRLTVLRLDLAMLERETRTDYPARLPPYVDRLKKDIDQVLALVRDIATRLRPAALDVSLAAAVEGLLAEYAKAATMRCELVNTLDPVLSLEDTVAITAFRVVQEALTNAARHGHACHVRIELGLRQDRLEVCVTDDGIGFSPAQTPRAGLGLRGMRERVAQLGGQFDIESQIDRGSTVRALLPLKSDATAANTASAPPDPSPTSPQLP